MINPDGRLKKNYFFFEKIICSFSRFIKEDGTLWLIRLNDENQELINVACPFHLNHVVCSVDKIGVSTSDRQILVRVGCTNDCPGGDGWIFVEHR